MVDSPSLQACMFSALLGAFIGGTTNFLALRMLFRPHRPWRIFGYRLPLTPGMLPRRQGELADSVARMISEHLIPPGELLKAVDTIEFRTAVKGTIRNNLEEILNQAVGEAIQSFGGDWDRLAAITCDHLQANLIAVADTAEVRRALEIMARRQAERIADHLSRRLPPAIFSPLRSVFERRFEPVIRQAVAAALHDCLKSPATIATAIEELRPRIEKQIKNARPADYIPEKAIDGVAESLTERVINFLRSDVDEIIANIDIRAMVADKIRSFPSEKIETLALECARREFVAITLFGVFIGALVGLLNPLFYVYLNL